MPSKAVRLTSLMGTGAARDAQTESRPCPDRDGARWRHEPEWATPPSGSNGPTGPAQARPVGPDFGTVSRIGVGAFRVRPNLRISSISPRLTCRLRLPARRAPRAPLSGVPRGPRYRASPVNLRCRPAPNSRSCEGGRRAPFDPVPAPAPSRISREKYAVAPGCQPPAHPRKLSGADQALCAAARDVRPPVSDPRAPSRTRGSRHPLVRCWSRSLNIRRVPAPSSPGRLAAAKAQKRPPARAWGTKIVESPALFGYGAGALPTIGRTARVVNLNVAPPGTRASSIGVPRRDLKHPDRAA